MYAGRTMTREPMARERGRLTYARMSNCRRPSPGQISIAWTGSERLEGAVLQAISYQKRAILECPKS
jgi:hypothetical protein